MSREVAVRSDIVIPAHRAVVWDILTDFANYGAWHPYLERIEGACEAGSQLTFHINMPDGSKRLAKARLTVARKYEALVWEGGLPLLIHGAHRQLLSDNGTGGTHFANGEFFTGLLGWLWVARRREKMLRGFELTNAALAKLAAARMAAA